MNEPDKYRKFSRNSIDNLKLAIGSIIWDEVLLSHVVNNAYELFLKSFNKALDVSFPLMSTKSRNQSSLNPSPMNTVTYKKCKKTIHSLSKKSKENILF